MTEWVKSVLNLVLLHTRIVLSRCTIICTLPLYDFGLIPCPSFPKGVKLRPSFSLTLIKIRRLLNKSNVY